MSFLWTLLTTRSWKSESFPVKDSKVADERTLIIIEASLETDFSYLKEFGFRVLKRKEYKTNVHMFIEKEKKEL